MNKELQELSTDCQHFTDGNMRILNKISKVTEGGKTGIQLWSPHFRFGLPFFWCSTNGKEKVLSIHRMQNQVFSRNIMRLLMLIISFNFVFCQSVLCYINGVRNMDIRLYLHIGCVYFSIHNLLSYVNTRINFLFLGT